MLNKADFELAKEGLLGVLSKKAHLSEQRIQKHTEEALTLVEHFSIKNPHTGEVSIVSDYSKPLQHLADIVASYHQ